MASLVSEYGIFLMAITTPIKSGQQDFPQNSVSSSLLNLTWTMTVSIVANIGVSVIDVWFISKLGTIPLAAISFTLPVVMFLTSIAFGISMGAISVISRVIGAGNFIDARNLNAHGLLLISTVVSIFAGGLYLASEPIFHLAGATPSIFPEIQSYMNIWLLASIPMAISMMVTQMLRATGYVNFPVRVITLAAGIHILLDLLLIFGFYMIPQLDIAGAAWALLVSRIFSSIVMLHKLNNHYNLFASGFKFKQIMTNWYRIMQIGLPATLTQLVSPISFFILIRFIAEYGTNAIAGFGVGARIEILVLVPFFALTASVAPFVGQSMGSGNVDRIYECVRISVKWCLLWGALTAVLLGLGSWTIAAFFDSNPDVQKVTVEYFWIMPWSYGIWGVLMIATSVFNSIGKPVPGTVISVVRACLLSIPLAFLASIWFGYYGIFLAFAVANLISGCAGYLWLNRTLTRTLGRL